MTGIVYDLDERSYHAHQALSSTEARILLKDGGPARYRWAKDNPPLIPPSVKFDIGSATHAKVLGVGAQVVIIDADDWRTAAARGARDEARAEGKVPLLRKDYTVIDAMSEAVLANPTARAIFQQPGDREVSVFASDPDTGVEVRARFDFLPDLTLDRPIAADLKTTAAEATPADFGRSAASYGYDVQEEHYLHALDHCGETGNRPSFAFVVVEKTAPYLVAVLQLPEVLVDRGRRRARRAREIYAECTRTGVWPGLSEEPKYVDVPNWVIYEDEPEEMEVA